MSNEKRTKMSVKIDFWEKTRSPNKAETTNLKNINLKKEKKSEKEISFKNHFPLQKNSDLVWE